MMPEDEAKEPPVTFTKTEAVENQKVAFTIQQNFLRNHQEITSATMSDLATMIRQEKQMYSNLAIAYAVNYMAAMEKRKKK